MKIKDYQYPTRVDILSIEGSYNSLWPPENGQEFLDFMRNKIREAPEEYRDSVKVEFGSETDYDSSTPTLNIYYCRPATIDEILKRKQDDEDWAQRQLKQARETLARLQLQLGNEP